MTVPEDKKIPNTYPDTPYWKMMGFNNSNAAWRKHIKESDIKTILNEWGYESERPHGEIEQSIKNLLLGEKQ